MNFLDYEKIIWILLVGLERLYFPLLEASCPRSGNEKVAGLEMADLEALGHVKFDVLGINLLDKLMKIQEITNES